MLVMAGGALYRAAIAHDAVATNHRRCGRVDEDPLAEKQERRAKQHVPEHL
jgi:hypothetical protein